MAASGCGGDGRDRNSNEDNCSAKQVCMKQATSGLCRSARGQQCICLWGQEGVGRGSGRRAQGVGSEVPAEVEGCTCRMGVLMLMLYAVEARSDKQTQTSVEVASSQNLPKRP